MSLSYNELLTLSPLITEFSRLRSETKILKDCYVKHQKQLQKEAWFSLSKAVYLSKIDRTKHGLFYLDGETLPETRAEKYSSPPTQSNLLTSVEAKWNNGGTSTGRLTMYLRNDKQRDYNLQYKTCYLEPGAESDSSMNPRNLLYGNIEVKLVIRLLFRPIKMSE